MCPENNESRSESIPVITDLIDNIMSIPSCLQDAKSKVTLVREWIKQNPKSPDKGLDHVKKQSLDSSSGSDSGNVTPTDGGGGGPECKDHSCPINEKVKT